MIFKLAPVKEAHKSRNILWMLEANLFECQCFLGNYSGQCTEFCICVYLLNPQFYLHLTEEQGDKEMLSNLPKVTQLRNISPGILLWIKLYSLKIHVLKSYPNHMASGYGLI